MAKKKIEHEIDDELEDNELDDQETDDEDEDDDDEEEDGKLEEDSDRKDSTEDGASSEEGEEDDDPEASSKKKAEQEELKEKRARRRREKKMRRERQRRERMQLQNTIVLMADQIKKLKDGQGDVHKKFEGLTTKHIDGEIAELGKLYNQAQAAMESAINDGDGSKFAKAKQISDKAWARYTFLEAQKQQRPTKATQDDKQIEDRESSRLEINNSADAASEGVQLGKEGKRYGIAFVTRHKSWYDPSGGNRDSKIVLAIDADLYNEGYDPEDKDYWEELESRCKEYLPHHFKRQNIAGKKPKSPVGGSGNDSSHSGNPEKTLPKEFIQTLKAAGYWEDGAKRKLAIKNYYANKKGA